MSKANDPFLLFDASGGLSLSVVRTADGLLVNGAAHLSGGHLKRFSKWLRDADADAAVPGEPEAWMAEIPGPDLNRLQHALQLLVQHAMSGDLAETERLADRLWVEIVRRTAHEND